MRLAYTAYELVGHDGPEMFSVNVLVQLVKNSRYMFAHHAGVDALRLERNVKTGSFGLGEYGVIPKTVAEDHKELSALVLVTEPTFVGCLIESRVIGMFQLAIGSARKTRIICVPTRDHSYSGTSLLNDMGPSVQHAIEHYFTNDDPLEDTMLRFDRWGTRDEAWKRIEEAHALFIHERQQYQDSGEGGGN